MIKTILFIVACVAIIYLALTSILSMVMLHALVRNNKEKLENQTKLTAGKGTQISFLIIGILFAYIMYYIYV
jgi:uncharacterized SAM-binding protein YcdF (DUF218 family)